MLRNSNLSHSPVRGSGLLLISTSALLSTFLADEGWAAPWKQYAQPEAAGWSSERLEEARAAAENLGTAALMIVERGHVVAAWGAVGHPFKTHSMRKSLYGAVIGAYWNEGAFRIDATLAELGIDDIEKLTAEEASARVEDVLAARSGVYLPAAYETESNAERRPERGSHPAGSHWYYNNWDFNVVPEIFRLQTGVPIERAFTERIAMPLGFEDFEPERDVFSWLEPGISRFPAVLFRVSARDLARVGCLVLNEGRFEGEEIVSADWIERSTRTVTDLRTAPGSGTGPGRDGYGLLWWIMEPDPTSEVAWRRLRRIAALGAGGHAMFLVPSLDLVIVHRVDTDRGMSIDDGRVAALVESVFDARTRGAAAGAATAGAEAAAAAAPSAWPTEVDAAELTPLVPAPLGTIAPAPVPDSSPLPVPESLRSQLAGTYVGSNGVEVRVFTQDGRLFAHRDVPIASEVELFAAPDASVFSPEAPLRIARVAPGTGPAGALVLTLGGRRLELTRTGD